MPLIIHSPYSGREVKIRDQDVGRAVRDEENRIFYVLERADGSGHYAAPTRAGHPREEARYDELVAKIATTRASGQLNSEKQVHDASGKPRVNLVGRAVVMVILLIIVAAAYLYLSGNLDNILRKQGVLPPQHEEPKSLVPPPKTSEATEATETTAPTPVAPASPATATPTKPTSMLQLKLELAVFCPPMQPFPFSLKA